MPKNKPLKGEIRVCYSKINHEIMRVKYVSSFLVIHLPDGTKISGVFSVNNFSKNDFNRYHKDRKLLCDDEVTFSVSQWPPTPEELGVIDMLGYTKLIPVINTAMLKKDAKVRK